MINAYNRKKPIKLANHVSIVMVSFTGKELAKDRMDG